MFINLSENYYLFSLNIFKEIPTKYYHHFKLSLLINNKYLLPNVLTDLKKRFPSIFRLLQLHSVNNRTKNVRKKSCYIINAFVWQK